MGHSFQCHCLFELTVAISISSWHVKFADPGIVVYENVDTGYDVGDGMTSSGFLQWPPKSAAVSHSLVSVEAFSGKNP